MLAAVRADGTRYQGRVKGKLPAYGLGTNLGHLDALLNPAASADVALIAAGPYRRYPRRRVGDRLPVADGQTNTNQRKDGKCGRENSIGAHGERDAERCAARGAPMQTDAQSAHPLKQKLANLTCKVAMK